MGLSLFLMQRGCGACSVTSKCNFPGISIQGGWATYRRGGR
jgi:hypothetical protein